jgi:hypothetical protein
MLSFYVVDNQTFRNLYRFASQYGPFCVTKRTVLQREMARFALPNGMYVFRVKIFRDFARWSFIFLWEKNQQPFSYNIRVAIKFCICVGEENNIQCLAVLTSILQPRYEA